MEIFHWFYNYNSIFHNLFKPDQINGFLESKQALANLAHRGRIIKIKVKIYTERFKLKLIGLFNDLWPSILWPFYSLLT